LSAIKFIAAVSWGKIVLSLIKTRAHNPVRQLISVVERCDFTDVTSVTIDRKFGKLVA
jgi:hypothetical protein